MSKLIDESRILLISTIEALEKLPYEEKRRVIETLVTWYRYQPKPQPADSAQQDDKA